MKKNIKYPTTKLEDIFHYHNDKISEFNLALARCEAGFDPDDVYLHFRERINQIKDQYHSLLNPSDSYSFKSTKELEQFLLNLGLFDEKEIADAIEHEQAHYDKAKELNYDIKEFCCRLALNKMGKITYALETSILLYSLPKAEDLRSIALAPKKPSVIDEMLFSKKNSEE